MRRETQNLLLVLLGGALLKIAFTGTYLRYVKPALFPWLVGAGSVMVLLAAVAIVRDIRVAREQARAEDPFAPPPSTGHAEHEHGHEHRTRSPWMLLLPVFAIFLIAPPALGADSIGRGGQQAAAPERPGDDALFDALPPGPAPLLTVSEFITRVVWDGSGSLDRRAIRLRGFVVHPEDDPARTQLARMRISCCAADAAPVLIDLAGPAAGALTATPPDTWIEVTGTLRAGTATPANGQVPTFDITAVHGIPAPDDPYEY
ncbi:TIGR03943 family protein [Saccharopolyspora gloriosae]|uniref:Putative repeat protein (TIGR03943 family) n=1 Tax=Saccharopolyspora gloriosae TaxID=455344 RepID=A0A840N8I8_9PSEU|nr:TIGR03943 family protein [Saccharopolyspora gloriosae]MBB5067944.1 putative repeat protein (TIGR03943 family) [Saccharopolyspora gloriosae]